MMPEEALSNSQRTPPSAGTADSSSVEEGAKDGLNLERIATFKDYLVRINLMVNIRLCTHNFSEFSNTETPGTSSYMLQQWSLLPLLGSPCP